MAVERRVFLVMGFSGKRAQVSLEQAPPEGKEVQSGELQGMGWLEEEELLLLQRSQVREEPRSRWRVVGWRGVWR